VDGELIERFLDVDEQTQEDICEGLGPSVEDVRNLVEELKRVCNFSEHFISLFGQIRESSSISGVLRR
jgi:hypothetical protein